MTNELQKLLRAVSRGARVQWFNFHRLWLTTDTIDLDEDDRQRIHPEDEHLRFGPVSSALRRAAEDPPHTLDNAFAYAGFCMRQPEFVMLQSNLIDYQKYRNASKEDRTYFLLLLSEAICDEGM